LEKEGRRYPPVGLWKKWKKGGRGLVEKKEAKD
jgi:hypothetical protein